MLRRAGDRGVRKGMIDDRRCSIVQLKSQVLSWSLRAGKNKLHKGTFIKRAEIKEIAQRT